MIARELNSGLFAQECSEPNCRSMVFRFIVGLEYPVLECDACGRRHVLIDKHTKKPAGHELIMSDKPVKMHCPYCGGSGFEGTHGKCPYCYGSGIFYQDSVRKRAEKNKKEREKLAKKGLDPEVL